MVGPGSVQFLPVSLTGAIDSIAHLLRGGQTFRGLVLGDSDALVLLVAGARIRIPKSAGAFESGQRVVVTLVDSGQGPTLRISPQPAAVQAASAAPAAPIGLLSAVLESLGALSRQNLSAAASLLPANVALPEQAMRALLAVLVGHRDAGRALATVSTLLQNAVEAGVISPEAAQTVAKLAARMKAADAAAFRDALRAVRASTGKPVEARLAQLLLSGSESDVQAALRESLYAQLTQLRADRKLFAFLKSTGRLGAFETAVDGLLEQLRGGDVQRMSASEIPYQLIDLPLHPQSGFERAQVHFFGGGKNERQDGMPGTPLVVFDLSLSRLGDMWITLRTMEKTCTCRIETVDPKAATMIEEHSAELVDALAEAGYPGAVVESESWEGDRLAAVADLFRGVSGLDISA